MHDLPLLRALTSTAFFLAFALLTKVLVAIVYEYSWYFPPDFDSVFLAGREATFTGVYRWAFYTHILCGPIALLNGIYLLVSGWLRRNGSVYSDQNWPGLHRIMGWLQFAIVVFALVPSGLIMAPHAYSGQVAAAGFIVLSILTAVSTMMVVVNAKKVGRLGVDLHRRWAIRSWILLSSALWLRIAGGLASGLDLNSQLSYPWAAWISWLLPLSIYEYFCFLRFRKQQK